MYVVMFASKGTKRQDLAAVHFLMTFPAKTLTKVGYKKAGNFRLAVNEFFPLIVFSEIVSLLLPMFHLLLKPSNLF